MHPDNEAVIVWRNGVAWSDRPREVPYTVNARRAVGEWLEFRALLGADHDRPWVRRTEPRAGEPMSVMPSITCSATTLVQDGRASASGTPA
jgi:hypothetical protein